MGRIQNFVDSVLKQGLSYNNEYDFWFEKGTESGEKSVYDYLIDDVKFNGIQRDTKITGAEIGTSPGLKMKVLCEEISLPGVSTATGNGRGIYQGVDFKYAHTKIYNDLSMSFICDKDYTPLRFFEKWFHYVYNGTDDNKVGVSEPQYSSTRSYTTKPYYAYCMNMTIVKDEDKNGPIALNENNVRDYNASKRSAEYALINAFPISISSIPLNTGASQIVRFTVNLTYERWTMKVNDTTQPYNGKNLLMNLTP